MTKEIVEGPFESLARDQAGNIFVTTEKLFEGSLSKMKENMIARLCKEPFTFMVAEVFKREGEELGDVKFRVLGMVELLIRLEIKYPERFAQYKSEVMIAAATQVA